MNDHQKLLSLLKSHYPQAKIALDYSNNWELLVAVVLSAQCTDIRVNTVTRKLFRKYKTLNDYERIIKRIERGEATLKKRQEYADLLKWKTSKFENPWNELKISYGQNRGKQFTTEEDRFIVSILILI